MFVSIYFLTFFLILWGRNRKDLFKFPTTDSKYSISVLVPAWNEEKTIESTIKAIFESDYPLKELIVLNDGSTDNTKGVVESLLKKYPKLKLVNKKNSGKADSLNQGIKMAKAEFVAVVDADSYPDKDAFKKMIPYFDNPKVGAATCFIISKNRKNFMEKLQTIEYSIIAFTRKLLGYVDAIYVTPGPLALYRKTALDEVGGFDEKSMTEDIEITWNLIKHGWERRMCLSTKVSTTVPDNFKDWYTQRKRWNVGGLQCIKKYSGNFMKKGMLGSFVLPFFLLNLFSGLIGLGIFVYLTITRVLENYLFAKYSIQIGTPLMTMSDLAITPSFLNYLGVVLFILGGTFAVLILLVMKEKVLAKQNIFNIFFYLVIYLAAYPLIMISAMWDIVRGNVKWR